MGLVTPGAHFLLFVIFVCFVVDAGFE